MNKSKNAVHILDQMVGDDAELRHMIAEETLNAAVARMIYDARTNAGLTQRELADLVGTKQPVIARLEDADYAGHSLAMLSRIAKALQQALIVRLVPLQRPTTTSRPSHKRRIAAGVNH